MLAVILFQIGAGGGGGGGGGVTVFVSLVWAGNNWFYCFSLCRKK